MATIGPPRGLGVEKKKKSNSQVRGVTFITEDVVAPMVLLTT
jgi:hypothetical protein